LDLREYKYWIDKRCMSRISTLKRMIDKREERIETNNSEIKKFQRELRLKQRELKKLTDIWEINPQIKKPSPNSKYKNYRGRVRFWGRDKEFHIGSEEIYKGKSEEYWKDNIRKRFLKELTEDDLKQYLSEKLKVSLSKDGEYIIHPI